jgi:hypothetical protein
MNHSPYANYWEDCIRIQQLSDEIGTLDPKSPRNLKLRCKYGEIELKFYNRYLKYHKLDYPHHDKWWGQLVRIQGKLYAFIFKIEAEYKRCEISYSTYDKLIKDFEREIINEHAIRSGSSCPTTETRNTCRRLSKSRNANL